MGVTSEAEVVDTVDSISIRSSPSTLDSHVCTSGCHFDPGGRQQLFTRGFSQRQYSERPGKEFELRT